MSSNNTPSETNPYVPATPPGSDLPNQGNNNTPSETRPYVPPAPVKVPSAATFNNNTPSETVRYDPVNELNFNALINQRAEKFSMETVQNHPATVAQAITSGTPTTYLASLDTALREGGAYAMAADSFAGIPGALTTARLQAMSIIDPVARQEAFDYLDSLRALPMEQQVAMFPILSGTVQPSNFSLVSDQPLMTAGRGPIPATLGLELPNVDESVDRLVTIKTLFPNADIKIGSSTPFLEFLSDMQAEVTPSVDRLMDNFIYYADHPEQIAYEGVHLITTGLGAVISIPLGAAEDLARKLPGEYGAVAGDIIHNTADVASRTIDVLGREGQLLVGAVTYIPGLLLTGQGRQEGESVVDQFLRYADMTGPDQPFTTIIFDVQGIDINDPRYATERQFANELSMLESAVGVFDAFKAVRIAHTVPAEYVGAKLPGGLVGRNIIEGGFAEDVLGNRTFSGRGAKIAELWVETRAGGKFIESVGETVQSVTEGKLYTRADIVGALEAKFKGMSPAMAEALARGSTPAEFKRLLVDHVAEPGGNFPRIRLLGNTRRQVTEQLADAEEGRLKFPDDFIRDPDTGEVVEMFHGSPKLDIEGEQLDPLYANEANSWGPAAYMSDSSKVAGSPGFASRVKKVTETFDSYDAAVARAREIEKSGQSIGRPEVRQLGKPDVSDLGTVEGPRQVTWQVNAPGRVYTGYGRAARLFDSTDVISRQVKAQLKEDLEEAGYNVYQNGDSLSKLDKVQRGEPTVDRTISEIIDDAETGWDVYQRIAEEGGVRRADINEALAKQGFDGIRIDGAHDPMLAGTEVVPYNNYAMFKKEGWTPARGGFELRDQEIASLKARLIEIDSELAGLSLKEGTWKWPKKSVIKGILNDVPVGKVERFLSAVYKESHIPVHKLVNDAPRTDYLLEPGANPGWASSNVGTVRNILQRAGTPEITIRRLAGEVSGLVTRQDFTKWLTRIADAIEEGVTKSGKRTIDPAIIRDLTDNLRNPTFETEGVIHTKPVPGAQTARTRSVMEYPPETAKGLPEPGPSRPTDFPSGRVALPDVQRMVDATSFTRRLAGKARRGAELKKGMTFPQYSKALLHRASVLPYDTVKLVMDLGTVILKAPVLVLRLPAMILRIEFEQMARNAMFGYKPVLVNTGFLGDVIRGTSVGDAIFGPDGLFPKTLKIGDLPGENSLGMILSETHGRLTTSTTEVNLSKYLKDQKVLERDPVVRQQVIDTQVRSLNQLRADWLDRYLANHSIAETRIYLQTNEVARYWFENSMEPELRASLGAKHPLRTPVEEKPMTLRDVAPEDRAEVAQDLDAAFREEFGDMHTQTDAAGESARELRDAITKYAEGDNSQLPFIEAAFEEGDIASAIGNSAAPGRSTLRSIQTHADLRGLPEVAEGHTRVYRGGALDPAKDSGKWWTLDYQEALDYSKGRTDALGNDVPHPVPLERALSTEVRGAGKVYYRDIPNSELEALRATNPNEVRTLRDVTAKERADAANAGLITPDDIMDFARQEREGVQFVRGGADMAFEREHGQFILKGHQVGTAIEPPTPNVRGSLSGYDYDIGAAMDEWLTNESQYINEVTGNNPRLRRAVATGKWQVAGTDVGQALAGKTGGGFGEGTYERLQVELRAINDGVRQSLRSPEPNTVLLGEYYRRQEVILNKLKILQDAAEPRGYIDIRNGRAVRSHLGDSISDSTYELPASIMVDSTSKAGGFSGTPWENVNQILDGYNRIIYKPFKVANWVDVKGTRGSLYYQELERSYQTLVDGGWETGKALEVAQHRAALVTRDLMYDLSARTSAQMALRNVFWFAPAWQEILTTWLIKGPAQAYWPVGMGALINMGKATYDLFHEIGVIRTTEINGKKTDIVGMPHWFIGNPVEKVAAFFGQDVRIPDTIYGKPTGLNLVFQGLPSAAVVPGAVLSDLTVKHGGVFKALSDIFMPFGLDVSYAPSMLTYGWEAIWGTQPPWGSLSSAYNQANFDRTHDRSAQDAYGSMIDDGLTIPQIADFADGTDELTGNPKLSRPAELKYMEARDKWWDEWEHRTDEFFSGTAAVRFVGSSFFPMSLYATEDEREFYRAFFENFVVPKGFDSDGTLSESQKELINGYLAEHPDSVAYSIGYTGTGTPTSTLPWKSTGEEAYYDKLRTGELRILDPEEYQLKLEAITSQQHYRERQNAALSSLGSTAPQRLRNYYKVSQTILENKDEYERYLALNGDVRDYLGASRIDWEERYGYPVRSYSVERQVDLLFLLKSSTSFFMGAGGIRDSDYRHVVAALGELYSETGIFGKPRTPMEKGMSWYFDTVISKYMDEVGVLYDKANAMSARGEYAGDIYSQISSITTRYGSTPIIGPDGKKYPSPEAFFWGNQPATERRNDIIAWTTKPPSWLTPFQLKKVGLETSPATQSFLKFYDAKYTQFYDYIDKADISSGSNDYDAVRGILDRVLWAKAKSLGPAAENMLRLSEAPPVVRLNARKYSEGNDNWGYMMDYVERIYHAADVAGNSIKYYAQSILPMKITLEGIIENQLRNPNSQNYDQEFDRLWSRLSRSFSDPTQGALLYEAILFGQFNETDVQRGGIPDAINKTYGR